MIPKTRQEQKMQTYELLCDAAIQLFTSNGVEKTSIQDIATLAGVSVGSFYTYFDNKLALLEHLLVKFTREFTEYVEAVIAERPFADLEDAVRAHFTAVFGYHANHPQLSMLWTGYRSYISQETSRIVDQETEDHLRVLFKQPFYTTDLDLEIAVQAEIGIVHYLMTWWNADRSRMEMETLVEMLVRIALGGLHTTGRQPKKTAAGPVGSQ